MHVDAILTVTLYVIGGALVFVGLYNFSFLSRSDKNDGWGFIVSFIALVTVAPAILAAGIYFLLPVLGFTVLKIYLGQHILTRLSLWAGALFLILLSFVRAKQSESSRGILAGIYSGVSGEFLYKLGLIMLVCAAYNSASYWIHVWY